MIVSSPRVVKPTCVPVSLDRKRFNCKQNRRLTTVELQWLWNHENMLETGQVQASECYSLRQVMRHNGDIISIF